MNGLATIVGELPGAFYLIFPCPLGCTYSTVQAYSTNLINFALSTKIETETCMFFALAELHVIS